MLANIRCKLTITKEMGDLYDYLLSASPRNRTKELLFLARLGSLIKTGKLQIAPTSVSPILHSVEHVRASAESPSPIAVQAQTDHTALTMEELNIDMAFLAGPPTSLAH